MGFYEAYFGQASKPRIESNKADEERGQFEAGRLDQSEYGNILKANALGQGGPSVAEAQLVQSRDAAVKNAHALAASGRGGNMAAANRAGTLGGAQATMQAGAQMSALRAQEQQAAQARYDDFIKARQMQLLQARGLSVEEAAAQLKAETEIASGNAQRSQAAFGGILSAAGGIVASDPLAKRGAQPIGYGFGAYGANPTAPTPIEPGGQLQREGPEGTYSRLTSTSAQAPNSRFATSGPASLGVTQPSDLGTSQLSGMSRDSSGALSLQPNQGPPVRPAGQKPADFGEAGLIEEGGKPGDVRAGSQRDTLKTLLEAIIAKDQSEPVEKKKTASQEVGGGLQAWGAALSGQNKVGSGWAMKTDQQPLGGSYPNLMGAPAPRSDKETKSGATPHGDLVAEAAQVQPFSFHYKPEAAAVQGVSTGERTGVMANRVPGSLETNPIYAPTVEKDEHGMASVNAGQATMANIAVTSDMAKQLLELRQEVADLKNLRADKPRGKKGDGLVKSDPASKAQIKALQDENSSLRQALSPQSGEIPQGHFRAPGEAPTAGEQMRAGNRAAHAVPYASQEQMAGADAADYANKKAQYDYNWEKYNTSVVRPAPAGAVIRNAAFTNRDLEARPPAGRITNQADMQRLGRQDEVPEQSEQSATPLRALKNINKAIQDSGEAKAPALESLPEESQNAVRTELQTNREKALGDAASKLAAAKTREEKVKYLRQFEAARRIGATTEGPGQQTNNPGMDFQTPLVESLRQRGVKMNAKQIKKLQSEVSL